VKAAQDGSQLAAANKAKDNNNEGGSLEQQASDKSKK